MLQCSCKNNKYIQSCPLVNKAYEINRRIVIAMRLLGVGREEINIFCSVMDICQGLCISTYYSCLENLHSATSAIYDQVISKAVKEEQELQSESEPHENPKHLTVSGDGTWKNNNESLNSFIWTFAPKHVHAGTQTIEIANHLAVAIFNEGFLKILNIMALMGIIVGTEAHTFAVRRNELRIDRSELRASAASKSGGRTARLEERSSQNLDFEKEEGPMYGYEIAVNPK